MKLSSLNKFKDKNVEVEYWNEKTKNREAIIGTLDEIDACSIIIDFDTGLQNILIEDILRIERAEK